METLRLRRPQPARPGRDPFLHQDQDRNVALAFRDQGGGGVCHSDDEVMVYQHDIPCYQIVIFVTLQKNSAPRLVQFPICTLTQAACERSINPGRGGLQDTYRVWTVGPDNCVGHRVALTAGAVLMTAYDYHHVDL